MTPTSPGGLRQILARVLHRSLMVVPLAAAVALAVVSAGSAAPSGGTLTFALDRDGGCSDPHQSQWSTVQITSRPVVDSLIAQDPKTGKFKPWLASKWSASSNARDFTFTLKPGITFSDGKPLDAAAVKANFDRIVDPATKSTYAVLYLAGYKSTTIKDKRTFTVHFSRSNAGFLQAASTAFLGIESPATFAAGPASTCQKIVGSGPFTMSEYIPQKGITLVRRPGYKWAPPTAAHKGDARLSKLVFRIVPENGVRVSSLKAGEVDAIANVPTRQVGIMKDAGLNVIRANQPGFPYSLVLNQSHAPWNKVDARKAVRAAVDQDAIVKSVYQGLYPVAHSVIGSATPGYDHAYDKRKTYDPKLANSLLDKLGYDKRDGDGYRVKDGKRLTISWPVLSPAQYQRDIVAQLIQQQLKKVGIEAKLTPTSIPGVNALRANGDYDLLDPSVIAGDPGILSSNLGKDSLVRVDQPQLKKLLAEGLRTPDTAKRNAIYAKAQKLAFDTVQTIPINNIVYILGFSKKVSGMSFDAQGFPWFYDASIA